MSEYNSSRVRVIPFHDPDERYGWPNETPTPEPEHKLDSPDNRKLFNKLRDWLRQEQEWQADNREQMAIDCDYYDSIQTWKQEDLTVLEERGQAPLVFNKIKPVIDWVIGTERRTRVDWKILPRKQTEQKDAEIKTALFKYVSDVTKASFLRSRAFTHAIKAGVGWLEAGIRGDKSDDPLYVRRESWRNVWYDHNSVEPDLSDSRYLFRQRWVDLDIAEATFPDRALMLRSASAWRDNASITDEYDLSNPISQYQSRDSQGRLVGPTHTASIGGEPIGQRQQVKLFEGWYTVPENQTLIRGGQFRGQYNKDDPAMTKAVHDGLASTYDALVMQMRLCIFCDKGLLHESASPYRHNRFPLVPIWAYRRDRDNAPYGAIRAVRDPQDDMNKRASKALFLLSANRIVADEDVATIDRWDEIREEVARPDGMILLNGNKRDGRFEIDRSHQQLAAGHMELAASDAKLIEEISGINSENMGRETNARSGKAILARQSEGGILTTELFDNYRLAISLLGDIMLSLIEQFYDEEKIIRVTGGRGRTDWLEINKPQLGPNGWSYLNDITASQADFVVSEQDYRESMRIAMFESMSELVGKLPPEVSLQLLDLVVDFADAPGKDEIVRRIRKINGQQDPSTSDDSPEAQAARQADEERRQKAKKLDDVKLDELLAKVEKLRAEAANLQAARVRTGTEAMYSSMQTAQVIAGTPEVAPIADEVMRASGYQPPNPPGADPNLPQPAPMPLPLVGSSPLPAPIPNPSTAGAGERRGIETQRNDGV